MAAEAMEDERIKERFLHFLATFSTVGRDGNIVYPYQAEARKLAFSEERRSILIDFQDLAYASPELAEEVIREPTKTIKKLEEALREYIRSLNPYIRDKRLNAIRVRLTNVGRPVRIRELFNADLINQLVQFSGIVVKTTQVKHILRKVMFRCLRCGMIFFKEFDFEYEKPKQCPNPQCENTTKFEELKETREFEEYQEVSIQELPEELPPGQLPQSVTIIIRGDLAGKVRPGDRVRVYGIVRVFAERRFSEFRRPLFNIYVEALYVESGFEKSEDLTLTDEDVQRIMELKNDPDLEEKIYSSIAPSVYGHKVVKKAIAALLFGGVQKVNPDGTRIRGDIHILLIGDPGIGKSQLLKYTAQIAPRGVYATGKGTTAAGLTAAVVKTDSGWVLEAGVLVLADKGVACIDEFDKMNKDDRRALHEAMEQQTISIAKAGIVATLNARASILAAANPRFGRFIRGKDLSENVDLPPTLLSRFDLIFLLLDEPDPKRDLQEAEHILGIHAREIKPTPPIPIELFKKYIIYARERVFPKLTPEAERKLKEFYLKMRSMSRSESEESLTVPAIAITKRQLEALVRLAEAHARMLLKDRVDEKDAEFAIELMTESLKQVARDPRTGELDVTTIMTGQSASKRSKYLQVLDIISELEAEYPDGVPAKRIIEVARERGISEEFVYKVLYQESRKGSLYQPKPGRYKVVRWA